MKSLAPWCCIVAVVGTSIGQAAPGVEAYRAGHYALAAKTLPSEAVRDPVASYYLGMMYLYGYAELRNPVLALRYITQAAEKNYMPAQKLLGVYYLQKENMPDKAFFWFNKAAQAKDLDAQMYCAAAYLYGYGVKKNPDIAKKYYIDAARQGNSVAQYFLAEEFLNSRDSQNRKMGLIWLNKAADLKNPRALSRLGELYASGTLVPLDKIQAAYYMEQAANMGFTGALVKRGELARNSNDLEGAKQWFMKAIAAQNPEGAYQLALLYLTPNTALTNQNEGMSWLLKAANGGIYDAQNLLAKQYKEGQGVDKNEQLAAEWEKKALKTRNNSSLQGKQDVAKWLNNGQSMVFPSAYQLSGIFSAWQNPQALIDNNYNASPEMQDITRQVVYKPQYAMVKPSDIPINAYFSMLVPVLGQQAREWVYPRYPLDPAISALRFETSYINSDKPSEPLFSPMQYLDEKIASMENKVRYQILVTDLYNKAILGEPGAQFEIGQLYQYGIGLPQNSEQARIYLELAAAQGELSAEYNLGILYLEGKTQPVDYAKGIEWLTDAAFKGNAYAQYVLANIYDNGLNKEEIKAAVAPDHAQSQAMYYLAASNHFGQAEYELADYLAKEIPQDLNVAALKKRDDLIKRLYRGAVSQGIAQAFLPLAFYDAMDPDPNRQAHAFHIAKKAAENGNSYGATLVGLMLDRGISVPANPTEAITWYEKAGMNPVSSFILGTYYALGLYVEPSIEKGQALLEQAAKAQFPYALFNLAILEHKNGKDYLPLLDKARALGNTEAGLLLADIYLNNPNNLQNIKQARDIYQYFAQRGDKNAQLKLGFLYDKGLDGASDNALAAQWYSMAARQNQPLAQFLLGFLYQLGRVDGQVNPAEALAWFNKAYSREVRARVAIGFLEETLNNNYKTALAHYLDAANQGDSLGQLNAGLIYAYGKGLPVDQTKAVELLTKSAVQNNAQAMTQLAYLYFYGLTDKRDEPKAVYWYKKAADLGENVALYQLGLFAETGVGLSLNAEDARHYYERAAAKGNEKAILALARLYQYGVGVTQDYAQAVNFYKQLLDSHNSYAEYQLARIYLSGVLGAEQMAQGNGLLQTAAADGNIPAMHFLQLIKAQQATQVSYITPVLIDGESGGRAEKTANVMYMDALNEWNGGDETLSRRILHQVISKHPQFLPAKRAYEQLNTLQLTKQ